MLPIDFTSVERQAVPNLIFQNRVALSTLEIAACQRSKSIGKTFQSTYCIVSTTELFFDIFVLEGAKSVFGEFQKAAERRRSAANLVN